MSQMRIFPLVKTKNFVLGKKEWLLILSHKILGPLFLTLLDNNLCANNGIMRVKAILVKKKIINKEQFLNLSQWSKIQKMDKVHSRSKAAISFTSLIITWLANNHSTGKLISCTISTGLFSNSSNPKLILNLGYQSDMFIVMCLGGREPYQWIFRFLLITVKDKIRMTLYGWIYFPIPLTYKYLSLPIPPCF